MQNVIDFLERTGQDARWRHAESVELEQALADTEIEPAVRTAILRQDQRKLEALIGARANVCCAQHPAEDEDEEDEEGGDKNSTLYQFVSASVARAL